MSKGNKEIFAYYLISGLIVFFSLVYGIYDHYTTRPDSNDPGNEAMKVAVSNDESKEDETIFYFEVTGPDYTLDTCYIADKRGMMKGIKKSQLDVNKWYFVKNHPNIKNDFLYERPVHTILAKPYEKNCILITFDPTYTQDVKVYGLDKMLISFLYAFYDDHADVDRLTMLTKNSVKIDFNKFVDRTRVYGNDDLVGDVIRELLNSTAWNKKESITFN